MDGLSGVIVAFASGFSLIVLGVPLWLNRVPPNWWYGFRTRRTINDEALWYQVNQPTGRIFTITGIALLIVGVIGIGARYDDKQQSELVVLSLILVALGTGISIGKGVQITCGHGSSEDAS